MQRKADTPRKQTPVMARIEIPDKEWDDFFEEVITDLANHVSKTCKQTPTEPIVQHRLVHHSRELVDEEQ